MKTFADIQHVENHGNHDLSTATGLVDADKAYTLHISFEKKRDMDASKERAAIAEAIPHSAPQRLGRRSEAAELATDSDADKAYTCKNPDRQKFRVVL